MEKRISYSQFQQVKSAAKMIDPLKRKMQPLRKKIEAQVNVLKSYQTQVDALEAGIVQILGFHVADLVKKVIEPTGKTDTNGKPITVTKYLPTDIVSYDEQKKEYVISLPDDTLATFQPAEAASSEANKGGNAPESAEVPQSEETEALEGTDTVEQTQSDGNLPWEG